MITICSRAIFAKQSSEYRVNSNEKSILSVVKRIGIVYTVINERETDFVQKREGGICMKTGIFYIDKTDFYQGVVGVCGQGYTDHAPAQILGKKLRDRIG